MPSGQTVIIRDIRQRAYAKHLIDAAPVGAVVTIKEAGEARTAAQNRLLHRWFSDIERHQSIGQTAAEIKAQCNLTYGLPIKTRDDAEWASAFGYIFNSLNHEAKLKAIRVLDIPFTRSMGVRQLSEYMSQLSRDYLELGIHLTNPDEAKWGPVP
jgi:hypothetical protein